MPDAIWSSRECRGLARVSREYCQDETGEAVDVFTSMDDPDYIALLTSVRDVRKEMNALDLPGFKPNKSYFDQMKRFGLLDEDASTDLDWEALRDLDERYYQQQYRIFLNQETMPEVSPKATATSSGPKASPTVEKRKANVTNVTKKKKDETHVTQTCPMLSGSHDAARHNPAAGRGKRRPGLRHP